MKMNTLFFRSFLAVILLTMTVSQVDIKTASAGNYGDTEETIEEMGMRLPMAPIVEAPFAFPGIYLRAWMAVHEDVLNFLEPTEQSGSWHEDYLITFHEKNTEIIIVVGIDYRKMLGHSATYRVSKGDYRVIEKKWYK